MTRLLIVAIVVLLGVSVSASGRTTLGTSPAAKPTSTATKPAAVPPKTTAQGKNTTVAATKAAVKPTPRTVGPQNVTKANTTGSGARAGIGRFEFLAPDNRPADNDANFNGRRLQAANTTKSTAAATPASKPTATTKPTAKPVAKPAPRTAPAGGKPANATGKPANATGSGARAGIGRFEFLAPDNRPADNEANFQGRRLQAANTTKPTNAAKPTTPPKSVPKPTNGTKTAPKAPSKPSNGTGARAGIGKFTFLAPMNPPASNAANFEGRRLQAASAQNTTKPTTPHHATKPAAKPAAKPAVKPANATSKPTNATSKPANATGSGARAGIGKFETLSPLSPPSRNFANYGRRLFSLIFLQSSTTAKPLVSVTVTVTKPAAKVTAPDTPAKPTNATGGTARIGVSKYETVSPDTPSLQPADNALSVGRR